jgi:hypothetical protein
MFDLAEIRFGSMMMNFAYRAGLADGAKSALVPEGRARGLAGASRPGHQQRLS